MPPTTIDLSLALDYIAGRKRAEETLGFLAAVGQELAAPVDCGVSLQRTVDLCVPFLSNWCRISARPNPATEYEAHAASTKISRSESERFARFLAHVGPHARVAYSPEPGLALRCNDDELRRARQHGIGSGLVVPIRIGRLVIGQVAVLRPVDSPERHLGAAALAVVDELSSRVSIAVEIAELRREIASYRGSLALRAG